MPKWSKGRFIPKNPQKYIGKGQATWRSSWELHMMQFLDQHPGVEAWMSEGLRIPYRNPFTGKMTFYVPDFTVQYVDKNNNQHVELLEIKPAGQTHIEMAKGNRDKSAIALNYAKWTSAQAFAKEHGMVFRVITENQLFGSPGRVVKRR